MIIFTSFPFYYICAHNYEYYNIFRIESKFIFTNYTAAVQYFYNVKNRTPAGIRFLILY